MKKRKQKKGYPVRYFKEAARMMRVLGHPVRFTIIFKLSSGNELTVSNLQRILKMDQSPLSQHLNLLKQEGVLKSRRKGKNIYYSQKNNNICMAIGLMIDIIKLAEKAGSKR